MDPPVCMVIEHESPWSGFPHQTVTTARNAQTSRVKYKHPRCPSRRAEV